MDKPVAVDENEKETAALDRFLASVERRAYRTALMMVRDTHDAMDIVQDAMFKLARKYATRPESEWPLLFHRILHNRIMDTHRQRKSEGLWVRLFERVADDEGEDTIYEEPAAAEHWQPVERVQHAAFAEALDEAVTHLPTRQQQAFLLRVWEGLDVEQTAGVMGVSEGSVKTHLFRALENLRAQLKEFQP